MDVVSRRPVDEGAEDGAEDGAERAFEALREEVAALRRGLELVYRQVQAPAAVPVPAADAPDYSPTLGRMEQALRVIAGRLEAVERQPALRLTPASFQGELDAAARAAATAVSQPLVEAAREAKAATRELAALVEGARERREQRHWLWTAGGCGLILGAFLWFMLVAFLPYGAGDWLAALPLGGGPFQAGQALIRRDSPELWDEMVGLYKACGERTAEACEAAMAGRAGPPLPSQPEPTNIIPPGKTPSPRSATHGSQPGQHVQ